MGNQRRFALIGSSLGVLNLSSGPADNDILVYDTTTNKWVSQSLSTTGVPTVTSAQTISGDWTFTGEFNVGDPGSESGTITVNGATFNAVAKINEFGGTQDAELILHRHATSAPSNLVFSRSRGTTATHVDVQDGDILGRMIFVGRHTSSYYWGASIWAEIDGTPGVSDMPTSLAFGVSADGSSAPTERFRINPAGAFGISGETYGTASQSIVMSGGSAAPPSWLTAGTDDRVLRQTSGALNFGQLTAGMFPNTVVPDAALSSNVPLLNAINTFTFESSGLSYPLFLSAASTGFALNQTGGAENNRLWDFVVFSEKFQIRAKNDAGTTAAACLVVDRTGTTIDSFALSATAITLNGRDFGTSTLPALSGVNLTALSASNIASGSLADARLSANVPLLNAANTFTALPTMKWAAPSIQFRLADNTLVGAVGGGAGDGSMQLYSEGAVNILAGGNFVIQISTAGHIQALFPVQLKGYTVAGLPAGTIGDTAYVTDALAPVFGAAVAGGGAVTVPVYYTGAAWFVG